MLAAMVQWLHPWLLLPAAHQADDELPSGTIVLFRLVQPRCQIVMLAGRWGCIWGDPETNALKSLSIARSEKTLFIFGLTYCEGP